MFKSIELVLTLIPVLFLAVIIIMAISFLKDLGIKIPKHPLKSLAKWLKESFNHEKKETS